MNKTFLSFYIGQTLFGIDIQLVKEINRNIEYTPIPGTNEEILGLFNMRGQIVALFDLVKKIGFDTKSECLKYQCIIMKPLKDDSSYIGFLIDRTGDVIDFDVDNLEDKTANVHNDSVSHIIKLDNELLIILNPENIFL